MDGCCLHIFELYKVHFLHFYPPSLPLSTKLKGWGIKVGCWSWDCMLSDLSLWHIKSMMAKSKSSDFESPKGLVGCHSTEGRSPRCPREQQPQACPYVPCVPGAGRCSRQQRSWSAPPWRRTWAARGRRQRTRSCPPRFWHRQSGNTQTLGLHVLPLTPTQAMLDPNLQKLPSSACKLKERCCFSLLGACLFVLSLPPPPPLLVCFCKRSHQLLK